MSRSVRLTVPIMPTPFRASDHANDQKSHLLLACTGSVATIKLPQILNALSRHQEDLSVILILTTSATHFLQSQSDEQPSLLTIRERFGGLVKEIFTDADEWGRTQQQHDKQQALQPWRRGAEILHIELRRWADLLLIAPLSANSLAAMVNGFADSLVLSVARAWDTTGEIDAVRGRRIGAAREEGEEEEEEEEEGEEGGRGGLGEGEGGGGKLGSETPRKKVIIVAPAMNTAMWRHPITAVQMDVLENQWGVSCEGWVQVLRPQEKELACGDTGQGAMRDWSEVVMAVETRLGFRTDASGGLSET